MIAESAEMGRLMGLLGSARSMIVTCELSGFFSRTQMNLSDSMVNVLKVIFSGVIPKLVSCRCSVNLIGSCRAVILFNTREGNNQRTMTYEALILFLDVILKKE